MFLKRWKKRGTDKEVEEDKTANSVISSLFIKELIRRVHCELEESQQERMDAGHAPLFVVAGMTIEVHFVAIESKEAGVGLDFRVISLGGVGLNKKNKYRQEQIHKITLRLDAVSDKTASNYVTNPLILSLLGHKIV